VTSKSSNCTCVSHLQFYVLRSDLAEGVNVSGGCYVTVESGPHLGLQQACAFLHSTCPVSVHIIIHMNDDRCTDSVRAESQTCLCRLRAMRLCSCPLRQKSMLLTLPSMTSLVCWSLLRPFRVHLVQSESVNMSTCHCSSDTEDKFSLQNNSPPPAKHLLTSTPVCSRTLPGRLQERADPSQLLTEKASGPLQIVETQARQNSPRNGVIKPYYAVGQKSMLRQLGLHFVTGYNSFCISKKQSYRQA